jgi:hypothetical protein
MMPPADGFLAAITKILAAQGERARNIAVRDGRNSAVHSSAFLQRFVWQNAMRSARLVILRQRWRRRSRIEQGSDPIGLT